MSASMRVLSYASHSDGDSLEALAKRLAAEMRDTVRSLSLHPVLSPEWCIISEMLYRIANISEMEKKLPKAKADGTLWDGEEHALRYLLEDGKLNLSLRILDEYLAFLMSLDAMDKSLEHNDTVQCARFEFGIGVMLANVWLHKEAIQTTDFPLFSHCCKVIFERALYHKPMRLLAQAAAADAEVAASSAGVDDAPATAALPPRALESVAFRFVLAAAKAAVGQMERKVVAELARSGVLDRLLRHLAENSRRCDEEDVHAAYEALSIFATSEEFETSKARLFTTPECFAAAAALKEPASKLLDSTDASVRRKFRPLVDLLSELGRKAGKR